MNKVIKCGHRNDMFFVCEEARDFTYILSVHYSMDSAEKALKKITYKD